MDSIRSETHEDISTAKAELTQGLSGVRKALSVLRDYYGGAAAMVQEDAQFSDFMQQPAKPAAHAKASGAGSSIVNILEVCESDFANNLAKEETEEADAQASYEKTTQENKVSKAMKEQDVKSRLRKPHLLTRPSPSCPPTGTPPTTSCPLFSSIMARSRSAALPSLRPTKTARPAVKPRSRA